MEWSIEWEQLALRKAQDKGATTEMAIAWHRTGLFYQKLLNFIREFNTNTLFKLFNKIIKPLNLK